MMTAEEISERYGYSVSSIKKNFPRTAASIEKKYGIVLIKCKKDGRTYYEISDNRAETIYDETKEIVNIGKQTLNLANYEFFCFLGIIMTPQGIFRGTRKDFLNYVGIPINNKNLSMLDVVMQELVKKEYIMFDVDEDYIIVYVKRKIEKEMQVGINMIKHCRAIAEKHHKGGDKISQLIKVWLAVQICIDNPPFTYEDISELTGLSTYQIRDVKKMLEEDEIFKLSRVGSYYLNKGWTGDMNGFYS
jgi:hypothetical protein